MRTEHLHDAAAFSRALSVADRRAAETSWDLFARAKAVLGALCAAGTLATQGRLPTPNYREHVRTAVVLLAGLEEQMRAVRFRDDAEKVAFHDAIVTLLGQLQRSVLAPPAEAVDVWASTLACYAAGRLLASRYWLLEMRPEGLPLTPAARELFEEVSPAR
jgi:hypothetical protein